ncbi:MAG: hypothetical protein J6Q65_01385 [Lentisphaeria bacterium]|nr:hypothetical protein [Lentisphaeria bacterium]
MIRIGENTVLILSPDGRAIPFAHEELQRRLEKLLSAHMDSRELTVARDIASAVEMVLQNKFGNTAESVQPPCIKSEILDDLVCRILNGAGFRKAAETYRRENVANGGFVRIPLDRIRCFLEENLEVRGDELDRIAEKVFHTMKSIGADDSSPQLALELARHFCAVAAGKVAFNIAPPDFDPDKDCTIQPEQLIGKLSAESRVFFDNRILMVGKINLRIFPAIRLDLRLTGIGTYYHLVAPLTELALAPAFMQAARAADELCLIADELFRSRGNEADTPVKVILHLMDASVFTRDWMGCNSTLAQERCAVNLCKAFASELTRFPFQLTCT